uniref:Uncharacterized protein n=1 Tax=Glossina palpalis gambiensis TaxID=67801 RepID=A0A1B0B4D5_9MUSC
MDRIRKTVIAQQTYKANKMHSLAYSSTTPRIAIQASFLELCLDNSSIETVVRRPCVPDKSSPELPKRIQSIREWPGLRAHLLRKFPVAEPLLADFCDLIPSALNCSEELVLDFFR